MYSKVRLFLAQTLALAALAIVMHTWATVLSTLLHTAKLHMPAPWHMLLAGLASLAIAHLCGKCRWWQRMTLTQATALAAAATANLLMNVGALALSVFAFTVYALCLMAFSLATADWEYAEVRQWLTLVSVFMGLALLVAPFAGQPATLDALLGFSLASLLSLGFTWEQHVEATSKHAPTYRGAVWMLGAACLFFASVALAGRGVFSLRPLFAVIAGLGRELLLLVLYPFGYVAGALVVVLRFLQSLARSRTTPPREGASPWLDNPLPDVRELAEANPIFLQILGILFGVFLVAVLYVALARQMANKGLSQGDEREPLQVELRLPRLQWARKNKAKRPLLPREPKDIWEVIRFIEHWGAKLARPRRLGETMQEYARALIPLLPPEAMTTIVQNFEHCRYRERALTEAEWHAIYAAWAEARAVVSTHTPAPKL
ncbi:MAG: hypothetical protein DDT38_00206 [Firmicutes bacterium]|nr:hypothetical protein [candidate division NPL-UPA2 bacterium]